MSEFTIQNHENLLLCHQKSLPGFVRSWVLWWINELEPWPVLNISGRLLLKMPGGNKRVAYIHIYDTYVEKKNIYIYAYKYVYI